MSQYGAVDIGSNSVRMQVAEVVAGRHARILAEDRQVTRLGSSVFTEGHIQPEAMALTCEVLGRMAKTLAKFDLLGTRAVATSAVRDARNQDEFLARARQALGVPVEVIAGQEEARLIHLGVQSRWPHPTENVLIVDIGGGSAELMEGRQGQLSAAYSKPLGAVRLTEVFLKSDPPTTPELHRMDEYIQEKLEPAVQRMWKESHVRTIATAATASAVVSAVHGIPRAKRDQADHLQVWKSDLDELYEKLSQQTLEQRRKVTGIGPRRAELIVAGCAVLRRVLDEFRSPSLYFSTAGVRDGVVADLALRRVGWEAAKMDRDQRRTVRQLARRYGVPLKHGDKVASMARSLFESLRPLHGLAPLTGRLLEAAAYLHDVGHFISDSRHHRHSYYVILNSDLPGFTDRERLVIANLCRYHRKALPTLNHENYKALTEEERSTVESMIPLLRLADALDLGRAQRVADVKVHIQNGKVELYLESPEEVDLEQWGAQRVGQVFEQLYGRPLAVRKMKTR